MPIRVEPNAEPIPGYRFLDRIGGGGFGEVWRAEAPGGLFKAIKIIHGDLSHGDVDGNRQAEQELKALKRVQSLRHPYLLSLERYDIIDGRLLIVMELADCNLWDRFKVCRQQGLPGIPRAELMRLMEETAEVLDMMNNQYQLQHLDIKPQNLFLSCNHVKVADFGLVKDLEGMQAAVTGGVTPVYAAPETFTGKVTRFCDQYSLAIVYQELLTGVRPIQGANAQQLLMQHIRGVPNVDSLPPGDRPAVNRALSKVPEQRFPDCMDFVRALQQGSAQGQSPSASSMGHPAPPAQSMPARPLPALRTAATMQAKYDTPGFSRPSGTGLTHGGYSSAGHPYETPRTESRRSSESASTFHSVDLTQPPMAAPPEIRGEGCLAPTLVIGLGGYGLEVVSRFKQMIAGRFGSLSQLPSLRVLAIDTDISTIQEYLVKPDGAQVAPAELIETAMNRANHYMKPRRNGRSLIDGWCDPQTPYRIPRTPSTGGHRVLGRLALLDHYRPVSQAIRDAVQATLQPDALIQTERQTGLKMRSNRPRVYVVAALGGGTGSGMVLDMAYVARLKMGQMGYPDAEVRGLLLLPPAERRSVQDGALANSHAALRELRHYMQAGTTFSASYEERGGNLADPRAPFTQTFVQQAEGTRRDQAGPASAAFLDRELFTMLGRTADEERGAAHDPEAGSATVQVFGSAAMRWPRRELAALGSAAIAGSVLSRWVQIDPGTLRQPVQRWLAERWSEEGMAPAALSARFNQAAEQALGQTPEAFALSEAQPFLPKGWFARDPDPARLAATLQRIQGLVGMPDEHSLQRTVGSVETRLTEATQIILNQSGQKIVRLPLRLLEHPDYRVVGAIEGYGQLDGFLHAAIESHDALALEQNRIAVDAYYAVKGWLERDPARRKMTPADIAEALQSYPAARVQALTLRGIAKIYTAVRAELGGPLRDVTFCRDRLHETAAEFLQRRVEWLIPPDRLILPSGCQTPDQALAQLQASIRPDDLRTFDKQIQVKVEADFQALYHLCSQSGQRIEVLRDVIDQMARKFVQDRLAALSPAAMFFEHHPTMDSAAARVARLWEEAAPAKIGTGYNSRDEICLLGIPRGATEEQFLPISRKALPQVDFIPAAGDDEVTVYRELPSMPLSELPQMGPLAEDAFEAALPTGTAHVRTDVSEWLGQEVSHY